MLLRKDIAARELNKPYTYYTKVCVIKNKNEGPEYSDIKKPGFFSAKELKENYESGSLRQRSTWESQLLTRSRSPTLC